MLKIWGRKNSSNVRKALWTAEEAGVAFEAIDAGAPSGWSTIPSTARRTPMAWCRWWRMANWCSGSPTPSFATGRARYAAGDLYPEDPALRAQGDKWMDWTTSAFAPVFRDLFWGTLRTPPAERDPARIAAALARCSELLAMPERALAAQPFLSGERFAMGDIPWAASSTPGSRCPSSAPSCRPWRPGTRGSGNARPTARR